MCICIFQIEEIDVFFLQRGKEQENHFCKGFYAAVSSSTSRDVLKIIFMYNLLKNE